MNKTKRVLKTENTYLNFGGEFFVFRGTKASEKRTTHEEEMAQRKNEVWLTSDMK